MSEQISPDRPGGAGYSSRPAPRILALCELPCLAEFRPGEREVFAHTQMALTRLKDKISGTRPKPVEMVLSLLIAFAIGHVLACGTQWLLAGLGGWFGSWVEYGVFIPPVLILLALLVAQKLGRSQGVKFRPAKEGGVELELGRLWNHTVESFAPLYLMLLGLLFGTQTGLLQSLPDHMGLPIDGGFWNCLLITVDNLCHGLFLDTFELYRIHFAAPLEHSFQSATLFNIFRIGYDISIVLSIYALYQHRKFHRLLETLPSPPTAVTPIGTDPMDPLANWIGGVCADPDARWLNSYFDEMMYLQLSALYWERNVYPVYLISGRFLSINVDPDVSRMFVDEHGACQFQHHPA